MNDQYIQVGEHKVRYWQSGDQNAEPLILIHGLGGAIEYWKPLMPMLAERYCVYAPDLIGFGKSDKPKAAYNIACFATLIEKFIDTLNLDKVILVGHSMGGGIAMNVTMDMQERVNKLVLISSAGFGRELALPLKILSIPVLGELLTLPNKGGYKKVLQSNVYHNEAITDSFVDEMFDLVTLPGAQKALLRVIRANINVCGVRPNERKQVVERAQDFHLPMLVIWGQQDPLIPVMHAHRAKEVLPGSELILYEECGHIPPLEYPERLSQDILNFLNKD